MPQPLSPRPSAAYQAETEVAQIVGDILRLYRVLSGLPTLAPAEQTDALFRELVMLATQPRCDHTTWRVLADQDVRRVLPRLRQLCSTAECELERAWALRVIASADPRRALRRFPYFDNYEALTRLEFTTVTALAGGIPRRVLMVGAGPLPLTSLLLADEHEHAKIDNIDIDPRATRVAMRLADVLQARSMRFRCADVLSYRGIARYDLVYLAALVGTRPGDKARVVQHLYRRMRPGALLLARGAHSLRRLLYPPVETRDLAGFWPLAMVHPYTDVINSFVVAEKAPSRTARLRLAITPADELPERPHLDPPESTGR